jgi:hypothetical protein
MASQDSNMLALSSNNTGNAGASSMPPNVNATANPTQSQVSAAYASAVNDIGNAASATISFVNNTASNAVNSIPKTLAIPTFSAGPKLDTAALDAYKVNAVNAINSIQAVTEEKLNSIFPDAAKTDTEVKTNPDGSKTTTTVTTTRDKTGLVAVGKNGKPINFLSALSGGKAKKDSFGNSILDTVKTLKGWNNDLQDLRKKLLIPKIHLGIRGLPAGCGKNLTDGLNKEINGINKTIVSLNGKLVKKPTANLKCLTAIGGLFNDVSGIADAFSIQDSSVLLAGAGNLLTAGLAIGLYGMFGPTTANEPKKNVNKIAAKVAKPVVKKSDTISLHSMAKTTTTGSLKTTNPTLIKDYSSNYKKQPLTTKKDVLEEHGLIMDAYNTIDPNWNTTTTANGTVILNLSKLIGASPDFNSMLKNGIISTNDTANLLMLLAASYKPTDVNSSISDNFPKVALVNTSKNINPVTLNTNNASKAVAKVVKKAYVPPVSTSTYVKNADGTTTRTITTTDSNGLVTVSVVTYGVDGRQIVA